MKAPLLLVAVTILSLNYGNACIKNAQIYLIESLIDPRSRIRTWTTKCSTYAKASYCNWYNSININHYRKRVIFACPGGGAIAGMTFQFNQEKKDWLFSYKCCKLKYGIIRNKCTWTCTKNKLLGRLAFRLPRGYIMNGMASTYNSTYSDRLYKFFICPFKRECTTPIPTPPDTRR